MFTSLKTLLIGLPLIAQIGAVGGTMTGVAATTVAIHKTEQCHAQSIVTSHYSETIAISVPVTTVDDGTLAKGQESVANPGSAGEQRIDHTVTKHCGKFLHDETTAPVTIKQPVTEVKNIGTAYDDTEESPVAFDTQQVPDSSQLLGTSGVRSSGVPGVKQTTYHYAKNQGQDTTKTYVSEVVITAPVDEVNWYGTKAAPVAFPVKLSRTGICHAPGSTYYNQTLYYTPYNTLGECLQYGRMPLR